MQDILSPPATVNATVNIFLVIRNRLLRESLARLFEKENDLHVVGQDHYSERMLMQIVELQCDVLLLDLPGVLDSPHKIIPQLKTNSPHSGIILMGMDEDVGTFLRAVESGIAGYLLQEASATDIIAAIRDVARGGAACPPQLCLALFQRFARESKANVGALNQRIINKLGLTRRQQQLVMLVETGLTNKEIASRLNLSEFTIKNHIHALMKKLDAANRQEAIENIRSSGFMFAN